MKKSTLFRCYSVVIFICMVNIVLAQNTTIKDSVTTKLEDVNVVGIKKTFTIRNGNIKVDVANSIYNSVSNTLDLLSKLPKIQVSPDKETITVIGKGEPLLYIDNQKVEINDLNSLSVDDIKTVEIINNPSSKYEAEGRVVILITRKLGSKDGFKVDVTENASFKRYFNNYLGINSSVKKNKLEFKANFNYNQIKVWESNGNNFMIPDYDILSNFLVTAVTKRPQFIFGGGLFYKINEDDYFTINCNRRTQKDIFDIVTDTYNKEPSSNNFINTLNGNDENRNFTNGFLNYNHKIKSINGKLFSGLQYSNFNQQIASIIFNNYNNTNFQLSQNRNQRIRINVYSGRTDFEKEYKNKMKFELGALYFHANSATAFNIETINPNTITLSDYKYKETNIAGYSNLSGSIKKVNYSIGLRAENTIAKGENETSSNLIIDKNYINLFPKAEIEIPIDSTNTFTFNYAKSISRPNFSSTSQVSAYINPYFVWSNNINLNPTITDEISLGYQYKDKSLRLSYNNIKNPVYYATSYDDEQHLLTFQTANFEKESGYNLEFVLPFQHKFWTSTNTLSCILNKIEDKQSEVNASKPYLYYYSNHIFKLPKEVELSLTGWGLTKREEGIFQRNALFTIDLAVSKNFFRYFDCTVSYNDIFRQIKYYENFTINKVSAKGVYYTDSNMISFSIKYSFGKIKNEEYKEKSVNENLGRIR